MPNFTETWHVPTTEPFDDAEFYPQGTVVSLTAGAHVVEVTSDGDRCLENDDECVRTWEEFRARFPDGQTPEDATDGWTWIYNGWFSVAVDGDYDGEDVIYSLQEATDVARDHARRLAGTT